MLFWRLISSAIIITLLITAIVFDLRWGQEESLARPGILTVGIVGLLAVLAGIELDRLANPVRDMGRRLTLVAGVVLVVGCSAFPVFYVPYPANCPIGRLGWPVLGALLGLLLVLAREMYVFGREEVDAEAPEGAGPITQRLGVAALAMIYLGFPMAIIIQTRLLHSNTFGMWALLSIMVIPKVADAGAYFTGHAIGKHKLVPRLSPGKTIEGLAGGLIAGVLASLLLWYVIGPYLFDLTPRAGLVAAIAYGLILSLVSVFGDLAESLLKRDCRIKDSSHLLPGLGGVLDVIDSILTTAPAAYGFWMVLD